MTAGWKLFRIICILQMIIATLLLLNTFFEFIQSPSFGGIFRMLLFLLIMLLTILAVNMLNKNYPDNPVTGSQKRSFNRLFLLNFLFLAVLFGLVFGETGDVRQLAHITGKPVFQLPFGFFIMMIVYIVMLIFQFIILYGLYVLRRLLYQNFNKRRFEFEE